MRSLLPSNPQRDTGPFEDHPEAAHLSPLSQRVTIRRPTTGPIFRSRPNRSPFEEVNPLEHDENYDEFPDDRDYGELSPASPGRLSDSDDSTSSGSPDGTGTFGDGSGPTKSTLKDNATKVWLKAKQVAKWQIMSIAVRILLCYLLELFVDHLKRVLQFIVIVRSKLSDVVL